MAQYLATNRDGDQSLTVFGSDWQKPVAGTHPNFGTLLNYLATTPEAEHDEEYIKGLVDPTVGIGRVLQEHFGDRLTFDLHHLYLDGRKVDGGLSRAVKARMLAADQDWLRFAKFLVNLDRNPSRHAQQATWEWVSKHGLTVTEDGRFLGYKAVQNDGFSSSSGPDNYVNGVLYEGGETTRVPHEVGSVISKRRADVDDTPGGGCSVGLHVGTESYARGFAPRLMTVAVNPEHVVSASDSNLEWKIRVCEYEVISLADPVQFASTSYNVTPVDPEVEDALEDIEDDTALTQDQQERYDALVDHVGHDAALADALTWTEEQEDPNAPVALADLVQPEQGTGLLGRVVLRDWAKVNPGLARDLAGCQGHKAVARKYADITTEASVRRYRKTLA